MSRPRLPRALVALLALLVGFGWAPVTGLGPAATSSAALAHAGAQEGSHPVFDAREFPSIQDALDALPTGGGTVLVPAGTQVLTRKIRLRSRVELRGAGIDQTVLVLADGANDHLISNSDLRAGNSGLAIRDLGLRGNAANQSDWSFGVRLVNVRDAIVENVEASDFTKDGFYLGYNGQNGVHNIRVSGCRAVGNRRYGLAIKHGGGNLVEGCTFEGNGILEEGAGVKIGPDQGLAALDNRILGNWLIGNWAGVVLEAAVGYDSRVGGNLVCGNSAEDNLGAGFRDFRGEGNVFGGNSARGNGQDFDLGPTTVTDSEAGCSDGATPRDAADPDTAESGAAHPRR